MTLDEMILDRFDMTEENERVTIRLREGRLFWIKDVQNGGQTWELVSPDVEVPQESIAVQNPESYEIGWYQDINGDLYSFDGTTWIGTPPSKEKKKTLEYLG